MDDRDKKISKPGMPPLPPGFPRLGAPQLPQGGKPSLPGAPQLPSFSQVPAAPQFPQAAAPVRDTAAEDALKAEKDKLETKISDMEKLLSQEKEKALLATLKNQQDEALSSRVESSLKDIQEKMRRDRRDNEVEEERITLKGKIREMETRLAQERETWMQTLKSQVNERETQGRDVEGHFISRLQEMERRWLDEKAQWQKEISTREATINSLKYADVKLREMEDEFRRVSMEKEMTEREASRLRDEVARAEREKASIESYIKIIPEKERELAELKSDNAVLRGREENYRLEGKHRDEKHNFEIEKLQQEVGRLQADLGSISDRKNGEKNEELKKLQMHFEFQLQEKEKVIADVSGEKIRAMSELVKMKGFIGRVQAINAVLEKERGQLKLEKMQLAQNMAALLEDVKRLKHEGDFIKGARQAELESQAASYKAEADRAKSEYGARLSALHADEVSKLAASHQAEIARLSADSQAELARLSAERQAEMDAKISQLRVKYESAAEAEKGALRRELEESYGSQLKEARSALAAAQDASLKAEAEARRLASSSSNSESALAEKTRDYEARLAMTALQLSAVSSQKAEAEKYAQAARAEIQRLASEQAAARMELAALSSWKTAAGAELPKLKEDLRLESENRARFESELLYLKQKAQQLELKAQESAAALDAERSGLQASLAAQQARDSARIAELSAELAKYKIMESSFADRFKWAIKGKKSE